VGCGVWGEEFLEIGSQQHTVVAAVSGVNI
jgi:hypothetical protein